MSVRIGGGSEALTEKSQDTPRVAHTACAAFPETVFEEISRVRADWNVPGAHLLREVVVPPRTICQAGLGEMTRPLWSFNKNTGLMTAQWSVPRIILQRRVGQIERRFVFVLNLFLSGNRNGPSEK